MSDNRKAFLDTIAYSELGPALLKQSDNGYNIIVGSRPGKLITFDNYAAHPRRRVLLTKLGLFSTAAGRYQIRWQTWVECRDALGLRNFSPESQDLAALFLIKRRGALALIDQGNFDDAVVKCQKEWASFPGAGYKQHENKMAALQEAYVDAGGNLA